MRHARFLRSGMAPAAPTPSRQGSERRGFFASLVDVLHHSRRLQAESILRQYRHLIANADERAAFNQLSNLEDRDNVRH
jgi:hypothetical protein